MSDIKFEGPALQNPEAVTSDIKEAVELELVLEAEKRVKARLSSVLKHPTGYYRSRIVATRLQGNRGVSDSGVIYGPWLEGTGSRNKTTRFKGYSTFRMVRQQLDADSVKISEQIIASRIGALQ